MSVNCYWVGFDVAAMTRVFLAVDIYPIFIRVRDDTRRVRTGPLAGSVGRSPGVGGGLLD
jgi:hypothetical protein